MWIDKCTEFILLGKLLATHTFYKMGMNNIINLSSLAVKRIISGRRKKSYFFVRVFIEELSGIFVKSIAEGSAAAVDGKLRINDQIIEVQGYK